MALTTPISSPSQLIHLPVGHRPSPSSYAPFRGYTLIRSKFQVIALRNTGNSLFPVLPKFSSTVRFRCYGKSTEEREVDTLTSDNDDDSRENSHQSPNNVEKAEDGGSRRNVSSLSDALNLGIREPVYEVCYEIIQFHFCFSCSSGLQAGEIDIPRITLS